MDTQRLRENAETGRYVGSDYIAAADEIDRLRAELITAYAQAQENYELAESLRAENEALREHHKISVDQWTLEAQRVKELEDNVHELRAESKALQADAGRYRYLCRLNETNPEKFYEFPDACGWTKTEMDKLIDALRGEEEK